MISKNSISEDRVIQVKDVDKGANRQMLLEGSLDSLGGIEKIIRAISVPKVIYPDILNVEPPPKKDKNNKGV